MLDDLATFKDGALDGKGDMRCNVAICGAGPAGISLALTLARARPDWHVLLLEAGGQANASEPERDIYRAALGAKSYSVLDISRRRKLGGTTAHWGGWSKPLDAADYRDNPRWDLPAWPISAQALQEPLKEALHWIEIDSDDFAMDAVHARHRDKLLPLRSGGAIDEHLFRFSPPTRFGERYLDELRNQSNLTCLLHANLYQIERTGDRVSGLWVKPLSGEGLKIQADHYVLAMGGMETTRQLLNLRGDRAADGEGIYSPHLGRYFADHFGVRPGQILAPAELHYQRFGDVSGAVMPVLTFADTVLEQTHQHNSCMMLTATTATDSIMDGYGGNAAAGFYNGEYWHYNAQLIVEPRPNPLSRLILTDGRCALGLRRLKLDWQLHDDDFISAYQLYSALGDELGQTGLGRVRVNRPNSEPIRKNANGACHHLGSTRMAAMSEHGVVGPQLKVFGTDNLYIASSSVFPRYGYSNPTLTLVALAVRLAKHLAEAG